MAAPNQNPNYYPTYPTGTTTPVGTGTQTPPKQSGLDKAKHGGKAVFDKAWSAFEKLGAPVNKLTNKIGSEAFWPTTLDHESDKAARILKSFCSQLSPPLMLMWAWLMRNRGWILQRRARPIQGHPSLTGAKEQAQGPCQDSAKSH
jgi:hypothetical protein